MPLNATQRAQVVTAEKELQKKRRLERRMKRELREIFGNMTRDFRATYLATGNIINAQDYADEIRAVVGSQYRRAANAFSLDIIKFLRNVSRNEAEQVIKDLTVIAEFRGITLNQLIDEMEAQTVTRTGVFIRRRTALDVASIVETTQKQLDQSIERATRELTEELGRPPTRSEIAVASSRLFRKRSNARTGTIAATTTQGGAEGAKDISRDVFFETRNGPDAREAGLQPIPNQDVWITQGDSLVRTSPFNHRAADFQERENGVFTVSNEILKFPGDRSLGASKGNTINCRCSAVTVIK